MKKTEMSVYKKLKLSPFPRVLAEFRNDNSELQPQLVTKGFHSRDRATSLDATDPMSG